MANIDAFIQENPILHDVWEQQVTKGMRTMLCQVIEGRFGPLSQEVLDAINALDATQLSEVAPYAGTDSLDELRSRLGIDRQA